MPELGAPENSNLPELMSGVTWAMRLSKLWLSLTNCHFRPLRTLAWCCSAMSSVVFTAPATTKLEAESKVKDNANHLDFGSN